MNNFYHEELLEHYKYPKNKKQITDADFSAGEHNPSCGDIIYIEGKLENNILIDVGFDGKGCVISQATASLLTDHCLGKTITEILAITESSILTLIGISLGPVRTKCAILPLQVLKKGLVLFSKQ